LFLVLDGRAAPAPRLASFQHARGSLAPAELDAGLAVFDAMPARPCLRLSMPPLPPVMPLDWQTPARRSQRCPSCGWADVRRSIAHNAQDYLLSVVGLVPYRCRTCSERFHRTRHRLAPAR
jgi:hypothetical protein